MLSCFTQLVSSLHLMLKFCNSVKFCDLKIFTFIDFHQTQENHIIYRGGFHTFPPAVPHLSPHAACILSPKHIHPSFVSIALCLLHFFSTLLCIFRFLTSSLWIFHFPSSSPLDIVFVHHRPP